MVGSGRNSKSFKHLCMFSLPAKMKKIQSKMKVLEWPQHISHCKSMGISPQAQGQLTPQTVVGSGQNLNSVETLWLSSLPAKNEEDLNKNEGARVATRLCVDFSDFQGQITP